MKYLLLGGAGFIGTHLAKRLLNDGHEVTVVDSCLTSKTPNYDVDFIQLDLCHDSVETLVESHDVVYFLAGSVGVANIVNNPHATLNNNIGLMSKLIPIFEKHQKKVIFSSTSEVYGEGPFREDSSLNIGPPTDLRWSYAAAKLMTEFMITASTFPYTIVRFFNVTGPGQVGDYGMVLPRFINAAKTGTDLVIHGEGNQVRSFCHINDAVDILLKLEKINREIFNVGNNAPVTIKHLAERVIALTKSNSQLKFIPIPHSDISNRVPDLTKLKYMTGFVATYDLDDIIKDML